jgi:hypothetical protein
MGADGIDPRAIAKLARSASRHVYPEWSEPHGHGDTGEVSQRAIEAQIAAAVAGRKPLYFEPWGKDLSEAFAESCRRVLPDSVEVHARDGMLFIYRPAAIRRIMKADPAFYRAKGDTDLDSIARVSAVGMKGDLLGYGARSVTERPAHAVRIFRGKSLLLCYFVSTPELASAMKFAKKRAQDFVHAFGWEDVGFDLEPLA